MVLKRKKCKVDPDTLSGYVCSVKKTDPDSVLGSVSSELRPENVSSTLHIYLQNYQACQSEGGVCCGPTLAAIELPPLGEVAPSPDVLDCSWHAVDAGGTKGHCCCSVRCQSEAEPLSSPGRPLATASWARGVAPGKPDE